MSEPRKYPGVMPTERTHYAPYSAFEVPADLRVLHGRYDVDAVASLRSRVTAGVGLGRQFREDETLKFSSEAGLTWKDEEFPHGQGGDDLTMDYEIGNRIYKH